MTRKIRVAAIQSCPIAYNLSASLDKLDRLVADAVKGDTGSNGKKGINGNEDHIDKEVGDGVGRLQLVVLPEAFLSGYPRHWGGFNIGSRTTEQREWFGKYVKSSVMIPDNAIGKVWEGEDLHGDFEAFKRIAKAARDNQVYLSIGIVERSHIGSTLWCTNLLFSPLGILLSRHRKLQPTAAERVVWSQGEKINRPQSGPAIGAGDQEEDNLPVVRTELGRIGGLICWENFMPLARYVLYKKGVEIYTAPTADARPTWLPSMQHIAQEGRCFVISANQFHTPKDFPKHYPPSKESSQVKENEVWSRGGSCIVGPLGEILAGPLWDMGGIIYATLDMDLLHGARLDFDVSGHYGREDLLVDVINGMR